MHLEERWQTTIPGHLDHSFLADEGSSSVFVSDGWGVAYPALRVHRIDLWTGSHLADARTRHQAASALLVHDRHLYAATDSRLFEFEPTTLAVIRQWDRGLVRFARSLVSAGDRILAANWLAPTIGLLDRETGRTKRMRAGSQPLIARHGDLVKVIAGADGTLWTLDLEGHRLIDREVIPPVSRVTAGRHLWAIAAGPFVDDNASVRHRRDSNVLVRIGEAPLSVELGETCVRIACDDDAAVIWCVLGFSRLQAVSQRSGQVVFDTTTDPAHHLVHVDPGTRVALAARQLDPSSDGDAISSLICYRLPTLDR